MDTLLTPEQQAVRRLLFEHPKKIKNADDFQAYINDIIALGITPDNVLIGQAIEEWKKSHQIQGLKVHNPYAKITMNPFAIADGSYKPPKEDDGSKKRATGRGRKTGSLNQPGHNAGGDRRSIHVTRRSRDQPSILDFGNNDNNNEGDGGEGGNGDGSTSRRRSTRATRRRR